MHLLHLSKSNKNLKFSNIQKYFFTGTAARPSGFGTVVRKTPQNIDIPINFAEFKEKSEAANFASKLRTSTSSIPGGEDSHYYPRARDRADV